MNPFDYVNTINTSKKDLMEDPAAETHYVPFVVNKALSYFPDSIAGAQAMNLASHIDNKLQYHYLLNNIRPAKRFAKWAKKQDDGDLDVVKQYYGYGNEKAAQALRVLTEQELQLIRKRLERGGVNEKPSNTSGGPSKGR